jgi:hypothetical protein
MSIIKWTRTSYLSIRNFLSLQAILGIQNSTKVMQHICAHGKIKTDKRVRERQRQRDRDRDRDREAETGTDRQAEREGDTERS